MTKSKRGSGGLAIAISSSVLQTHNLVTVVKGIDGQMGIKLRNNENQMVIGVLGFYLSPDSYLYGQDPENFFG